jgi:putative endonuclease
LPTNRDAGADAETAVRRFLEAQGLLPLADNYRCRRGEVDLIMADGRALVFVEVRFRSTARYGGALASVDARKQSRLIAAAGHFLARNPRYAERTCRFDVVAVSKRNYQPHFEWIRDAFTA